ncbi:DUF4347 domain-containing protein [Zooshikella sp. RANM57]|uniref:DUF4347 domain-containing protein n=1 Tax=Zooshikella sp. RANM57 TaxID=3425863 RepID=UPI003D6EDABF
MQPKCQHRSSYRSLIHKYLKHGLRNSANAILRKKSSNFSSSPSQTPSLHSVSSASCLIALEKRFLFDGAAAATTADTVDSNENATETNTENTTSEELAQALAQPATTNNDDLESAEEQSDENKVVIFIDSRVADYQSLMEGLDESVDVVIIQEQQNGLEQMANALAEYSNLDAIHVVSHGDDGQLQLGNVTVSADNIANYSQYLSDIGAALTQQGDILLYGCDVGKGSAGEAFVQALADFTDADIAASTDDTGGDALGGNWNLEYSTGDVSNDSPFDSDMLASYDYLMALPISSDQTTTYDGLGLLDTVLIVNGTVIDDLSYDGWRFNGFGGETGIYPSALSLTNDVNTTGTRIYTSDSSNFKFTSVDYVIDTAGNPANASVTFYGFRDGSQVESQNFNAADTSSGTWTLNWGSVDEIKVAANTNWIFLDNLKVGAEIPANATPAISVNDTNLAYTEGTAATQVDGAATVSDADGDAEWNGGSLSAQITSNAEAGDRISIVDSDGDGTAITISGTNIFANGVDIGDLSASGGIVTGGTKLTITFDADATNANVQEVLQSIRYDSTTDDPGTNNRVITFTATDSSAASGSDTRTVVMTAVNDEPTLTANASDPTFTEGGAAASLFSGSNISTVESGQTVSGLTFTVTNVTNGSNERINIDGTTIVLTHGTNGSTASNSLNYSVSVIGTTATISLTGGSLSAAAAQTMVDNMSYQNNSNSPSTSNRVVTLTSVQDSGGTANGGDNTGSLAIASTVTVVQNNDEPTLTATGSNPTFTEGGAAASLYSGTSISTVEAGQTIKGLTFTITNVTNGSSEIINIDGTAIVLTHGTSGSTATNSLNYSVMVIGTTATVSLTGGTLSTAATQNMIDNMSYQNNSNTPSTSNRVVTLTSIQDSGGTANGGDDTASVAIASTVTVVGVNDEPTLTANASNPTFTEGGAAASLFNGTSISTVEAGQTITGLSFTITNVTNGSNERINIDGTTIVLTHGTNGSTAGNSLNYSVMVIGTTATVTMTGGNMSTAAAQTMIDNMSYQNNSNSPSTSNRVVTLTSIQDSGGTANGGDNTGSLAVASTVTVVQNNDEPTLTSNGSNPTFTEGGAAGSLFNGTSISTVEAGQTIKGFTFTVSNVANGINEVINIDGTAIILTHGTSGSTAGNSLSYSVTVVGTTATVALTGGTMSTATTQTLIDNMSYQNNSNTPSTSNRVVTLTSIQDSGGTANGGDDTASISVASTVTVVGVNDEPTLTANASNPTFTEGGAAASLFTGTNINTVESGQNITGLSFTITNVTNGSNERINIDGTTIVLTHGTNGSTAGNSLNYSVMVIGTTATVTMTGGNLSVAAAETMIDNMSYQNNSNSPSTSNRVVTLTSIQDSGGTANGGDNTGSLAVASTVTVVQNNDEPTLTANGSNPTFTEGGAAGSLFNGTSISTVEAGQTIKGFSFTVSNVANGINEVINIDGTAIVLAHGTSGTTAGNSLSYTTSVVGTTATVVFTGGTLSTATAQTLIDNMSYQNNSDTPSTSNRVVTLTSIQDSGGTANGGDDTASISVASTVTVVGVNDEPTLTANASNPTFTEGGAAASLFTGTDINTVESGQNITGLSFTITNVTNGSNERINIDGTTIVLTHGTNGSTAGNSLNYSVMVIGTTATVTMTGGNLSVAAAETMIDNMSYQNNSNSPSTSNRVVTLTSIQDSGGTANGGDNTGSLAVASTVTVVQNNDEPTLTSNGSNPTFTEGGAAGSLFNGTSISTVEAGQTIKGFSFTISNVANGINEVINIDGTAIVLTHGTSGSTAGNSLSYSVTVVGTTATVALTGGTMSTATTQTLIDNMSYQNNSNTPSTSNRVVTLSSIQDSGGTANGGDDTASISVASTVTVVGVNDEPTLTANASNPTFTEGGAAASLFTGTNINTVESGQNVTGLSFTITNVTNGSNERINIDGTTIVLTHGTNGSTAGNGLNYSVMVIGTTATVTMTGGNLSVAAAETMIDNMSYQNNSNTPSTSNRVVTLTSIQDSGGTANGGDNTGSLAVASTVTVVQNNDEPTLTSNGSNPTFTEGGAAGSLFNGTSISTVEAGQTIKGFTFSVSNVANGINEVINIDGTAIVLTHGTSGSTAGNSLSYSVSVVGTTATVALTGGTMSTATTQTLIDNMSYQNNSNTPSTSNRVVTLTSIQDSGGTANGGDDTASISVASTVTVVGVNDEPTLTANASNPTFTEGGAAASLFTGTNINTVESGQNVTGLSFTITNVTNGSNERINIDGTTIVLTHGTNGSTVGNGLNYSVIVIGTTATVSMTGGNLTVAAAETMIDNMSYQNNSNTPSTSNRVVTLTSIQDSGGTANGGDNTGSLAVASTVTVVQNNDEPTLTANGSNPTFTEGGAAGSLFNGTSISTVEAGQTIKGFTFTVSNVANGINEVINIDGTAIILTHGTSGSTAGNSLSYSVTVVGTTATVALTGGTMSTATTQTLIDNMSYQNNSNTPSTSNRVVTLTSIQDSGGTANGGDDTASISVASTITVVGVNDEPTLTANASNPTFIEDGAAASLFSGTTISTIETGQNISGFTLTVTNVANGGSEVLNIDGTSIALSHGTNGTTVGNSFNYTVIVVGNTATVTLSGGSISAASAQSLVDSISYQNNSNTPDTSNRVVTLTSIQDSGGTANGGDNTGSLAIASTVTVVGNNDAPTLSANANNPNFVEDGSAVNVFNGSSVSTVEAGQHITGLTFTITNITNISQEIINVDGASILLVNGVSGATTINGLNYAVSFSGSTATVVLTGGSLTTAQTQTLVDGITYQNNSQSPNTTPRVVTLTQITDDGGTANGGSDTKNLSVSSTVGVTSVNDVPTAMGLSNADLRLSSTTGIVGSLSTTDADIGDTHTYVLVSGVGGDHNGLFVIENNVIKAANTANLSGGVYTIRVKTIDGAGGSYERPFTITVIDDASLNYSQQNGNNIGADSPSDPPRRGNEPVGEGEPAFELENPLAPEPPTVNVVLPREAVAVNNVIDANQRTYNTTLTNIAVNTQVPPPVAFAPTYNFYTAIGRGFGINSSTPFGSPSNIGSPPGFNQDTGPADSNDVGSPDDSNNGDDDTRIEPTDRGDSGNSDTQDSNQGDSSPSSSDTNNSTFRPSFTEQLQLANNTNKKQALVDALVGTLPSEQGENAQKNELIVD